MTAKLTEGQVALLINIREGEWLSSDVLGSPEFDAAMDLIDAGLVKKKIVYIGDACISFRLTPAGIEARRAIEARRTGEGE